MTNAKPKPKPAASIQSERPLPPIAQRAPVDEGEREYVIAVLRDSEGHQVTESGHLGGGDVFTVAAIVMARNPDHAVRVFVLAATKDESPNNVPKQLHVLPVAAIHEKTWKPKNVRMQLVIE